MTSTDKSTDVSVDLSPLDSLTKVSDILAFFADLGVAVEDNDLDAIRSLKVLTEDDKNGLKGVPLLLIQWRFNSGDFGEFVSAEVAFEDGRLAVLNDGSTGICAQLRELSDHRERVGHPTPYAGRMVRGGISRSDYETEIDGKVTKAHTFYLQY